MPSNRRPRKRLSASINHTQTPRSKGQEQKQKSKITSWLKKEIVSPDQRTGQKPTKPLQEINTFEKYGVSIPSVTKIHADWKKYEEHKRILSSCHVHDEDTITVKKLYEKEAKSNSNQSLNCKYLTSDDICKYFSKFESVLKDIIKGKKYSDRHQRFHNSSRVYTHTTKDLMYNTSTSVFTPTQQHQMIDLMQDKFDTNQMMTSYFFKVLLPEFCLLIFMEEHQMNKTNALHYLDTRPLD